MLAKLDSSYFTWLNWRAGSIKELGIFCRYADITSACGKKILRSHAVGWCRGENLMCRPKVGQIALMCFKDGEHLWFHIRKKEFEEVFIKES